MATATPTPATDTAQALLDRLHHSLDHELGVASSKQAERDLDRRSEPRPRFRSWEQEAADQVSVRARGEI